MTAQHNRRNFLRGNLREDDSPIMRPPGAHPDFAKLCDGCGDCLQACPQNILVPSRKNGPAVDFALGACTFCGDCANACPTGALLEELQADWPWRATIQPACLSYQGISCRACEDACEASAIRFRLMTGGRAVPLIDEDRCNGCGECAFTCPTQAVSFERPRPANKELSA